MQIIPENCTAQVLPIPANPAMPEGAVSIIFMDGAGITIPIVIPRFQAIQLGSQILAVSRGGEENGPILPHAEPVYGPSDRDISPQEIEDLFDEAD